jgi:hypothetical protein
VPGWRALPDGPRSTPTGATGVIEASRPSTRRTRLTRLWSPPSVEQIFDVWEVRQALEKLPDQDRELIRLQHYAELTHTEIADELAIPLGTVKSRSFRAHRRLAGLLGHLRPESSTRAATHGAGSRPETRQDKKGGSDERR